MAENKKTTVSGQPATETTEKQAFDKNGKLQSGFAYRYETVQNEDGRRETRKVVFKVGEK